jgi:WD40 repeat protein
MEICFFQDACCAQVEMGWCCRASGSYDHTIRLWDIRTPKCVLQLEVRNLSHLHTILLGYAYFLSFCQQFISSWARALCYWGGRELVLSYWYAQEASGYIDM